MSYDAVRLDVPVFPGAAGIYGQQILDNQAIDPNYLPMDPGKIAFQRKSKSSALPKRGNEKRSREVIDPFDDSLRYDKL